MALNGIDISHYQEGLDLSKVPCDFVIIKATEGTYMVQDTCDSWVQQAKRLGKKWGFYHFAAGGEAIAEADFFVKNCRNYFGHGIPVLDYEMYGRKGTAWVKRFLDRVYEQTGIRCMVYTSRSVLKEEDWSEVAPNHTLWVAQYPNYEPTGYQSDPWFPKGSIGAFQFVTMHQYASTGRLPGWNGNLDLDIAYITPEGWDAIARGDGAKPAEPTETTLELAYKVMNGELGTGDDRKKALGSRYDEVQGFINHICFTSANVLADEVMKGKYGNGAVRKTVLGNRYAEVQAIINGDRKSVEQLAREVIAGKWGNGADRRKKLEAAGYEYEKVQAKVNELLQ